MFNKSKELIASTPGGGDGMVRVQLRTCLCASALILAGLAVVDPALARSPYDGAWSVTVMTRGGACEPSRATACRFPTEWSWPATAGRPCKDESPPGGAVSVAVQAGGQSASGSGHLNRARGSGVWARSRQRRRMPRHMGGTARRRRCPGPSRGARKADLQLRSPLLRAPLLWTAARPSQAGAPR